MKDRGVDSQNQFRDFSDSDENCCLEPLKDFFRDEVSRSDHESALVLYPQVFFFLFYFILFFIYFLFIL